MRSGHEEIKELLPDYIRGTIPVEMRSDIRIHLNECDECRTELSFLTELVKLETPDPGDLFWKTLPQKVKVALGEEKARSLPLRSFMLRQFPFAVTIAVAFFFIFTYIIKKEVPERDLTFIAPLTVSVLDYGDITERDLPLITEEPIVYELYTESFMEYSYHREFVSLSSKEMESLYEALGKEQKGGG